MRSPKIPAFTDDLFKLVFIPDLILFKIRKQDLVIPLLDPTTEHEQVPMNPTRDLGGNRIMVSPVTHNHI